MQVAVMQCGGTSFPLWDFGYENKMEQAVRKPGYVKVRLAYTTTLPVTHTSPLMQGVSSSDPRREVVTLLIKADKVFSMLGAYRDAFESLKDKKVIPAEAQLSGFQICPMDDRTLAYILPTV